jgi:hypothetical protein
VPHVSPRPPRTFRPNLGTRRTLPSALGPDGVSASIPRSERMPTGVAGFSLFVSARSCADGLYRIDIAPRLIGILSLERFLFQMRPTEKKRSHKVPSSLVNRCVVDGGADANPRMADSRTKKGGRASANPP